MQSKYERKLQEFCIMDDTFMSKVFESHNELVQLMLQIILQKNDLIVKSSTVQREIKSVGGHSVRFDVHAVDSTKKEYDIEVQRSDDGAIPQRARYNSAMLDSDMLKSGINYNSLKESYVIFITENDIFGKGLPIYTIKRTIEEINEFFNDGSHIIYVNGSYRGNNDIGKLMHDFHCVNSNDMNYKPLADRVSYFKNTEGGKYAMCKIMKELLNEQEIENKNKYAKNLILQGNLSLEDISKSLEMPIEDVQEIAEKI